MPRTTPLEEGLVNRKFVEEIKQTGNFPSRLSTTCPKGFETVIPEVHSDCGAFLGPEPTPLGNAVVGSEARHWLADYGEI
jgi:hypothetical protein